MNTFYEFFAGVGMAAAGLGPGWACAFANDISPQKAGIYASNFGGVHLVVLDVVKITTSDLPGRADLAWASPPCVDLSEAGKQKGLSAPRSGAVWPFLNLMKELLANGRAPRAIVIENVPNWLSDKLVGDFIAVIDALVAIGYRVGALVIDAASFLPQSRLRLFIVAVDAATPIPEALLGRCADLGYPSNALIKAYNRLPAELQAQWLQWRLPEPPRRTVELVDLLDLNARSCAWEFSPGEVQRHLSMMDEANAARVAEARALGHTIAGPFARRMRDVARSGKRVQRVEVRFDGLANALRFAGGGGSSKQFIAIIDGGRTRKRAISGREAARLMGLGDGFVLPADATAALSAMGDGVCAPVARHIAEHILEPLLAAQMPEPLSAASALS
jgi:DNA (cytosine-5)-methyltransferase 1